MGTIFGPTQCIFNATGPVPVYIGIVVYSINIHTYRKSNIFISLDFAFYIYLSVITCEIFFQDNFFSKGQIRLINRLINF